MENLFHIVDRTLKLSSLSENYEKSVGNCIYTWKRNGIWLYIGASKKGTHRLHDHHVINPDLIIPDKDTITFYFIEPSLTREDMIEQENRLIKKYQPFFNRRYKGLRLNEWHKWGDDAVKTIPYLIRDGKLHPTPVSCWYNLVPRIMRIKKWWYVHGIRTEL